MKLKVKVSRRISSAAAATCVSQPWQKCRDGPESGRLCVRARWHVPGFRKENVFGVFDWLIGWLVGWLIWLGNSIWLVDCRDWWIWMIGLTGWLNLFGWRIDVIGWVIEWFNLVGGLTWLVDLSDWLDIDWLVDLSDWSDIDWFGWLVERSSSVDGLMRLVDWLSDLIRLVDCHDWIWVIYFILIGLIRWLMEWFNLVGELTWLMDLGGWFVGW